MLHFGLLGAAALGRHLKVGGTGGGRLQGMAAAPCLSTQHLFNPRRRAEQACWPAGRTPAVQLQWSKGLLLGVAWDEHAAGACLPCLTLTAAARSGSDWAAQRGKVRGKTGGTPPDQPAQGGVAHTVAGSNLGLQHKHTSSQGLEELGWACSGGRARTGVRQTPIVWTGGRSPAD